ncbi:response regulator transcription factor [Bradyrhizobium lablabi]|uniref:LuxR C-terminal-related transcriptional regulator n=1 Tax=Bradyrhizobium lablabi TaxID=722472 RepID=UPI001BAB1BDA|nr:response regulator transcription factor [Bradyrhizobium lablabi]MBR1123202.1 response regulator transcription factor [Bradyrhizobium lablabi]
MLRQRFFSVVLIGKSILLREGLARILRAANFRILASVSSAVDLRQSKPTHGLPLFLIVHTGDDFEYVVELIENFRRMHPDGRIAVVADRYGLKEMSSAFRAGANGYFANAITCDRFTKSMELVMMGETIFPPAFLSRVLDPKSSQTVEATADDRMGEPILVAEKDTPPSLLSPREKLILRCIIGGDTNKCIGRKINIAEATVKVHVKAIFRKIGVQNRTQAAIWGLNNGFPHPGRRQMLPSISNGSFSGHVKTVSEEKQPEGLVPPSRRPSFSL